MCLSLNLPRPAIPAIMIPNPAFVVSINVGTVGVTCCHFTFPGITVDLSAAIATAIGLGGPLIIPLNVAIQSMNSAVDLALGVLDQINIPDCGLE